MKLIGIGNGTYTSKRDGQKKEGCRLYLTYPRENVAGIVCEECWVRKSVIAPFLAEFQSVDAAIGKEVNLYYDKYKSVVSVELVKPGK